MSQDDPIEITIINEKDSPFKQEQSDFRSQAVEIAGRAFRKTVHGAWIVGKKAWQSEARKKTTKVIGKQVNKAWQSEARKKVTRQASAQAGKLVERNKETIQQAVTQAVNQRLDQEKKRVTQKVTETDWKDVAQKGMIKGLKRLSRMLGQAAQKMGDRTNDPK